MSAQLINRTENGFTVQITVPYNRSMLDFEETLQQKLNDAGVLATQEGLRQFDTDGSPITVGPTAPNSSDSLCIIIIIYYIHILSNAWGRQYTKTRNSIGLKDAGFRRTNNQSWQPVAG
jgi:hypothetical protein